MAPRTQYFDTPFAYVTGDAQANQLLLDNGFDISAESFKIEDALMWAAWNGHAAVIEQLLNSGGDVQVKAEAEDGFVHPLLSGAAKRGHETVVKLLLENGADVNVRDSEGMTALHQAAMGG